LRVVNSAHHNPPILVAWLNSGSNSSVSWKDAENLTFQRRSKVANWTGKHKS
jgi:hypothetical protein